MEQNTTGTQKDARRDIPAPPPGARELIAGAVSRASGLSPEDDGWDAEYRAACLFLMDNGFFADAGDDPPLGRRLGDYLAHRGDSADAKKAFLWERIGSRLPTTGERLRLFEGERARSDPERQARDGGDAIHALDYLAAFLDREVHLMDDGGLRAFVTEMYRRATVGATRYLACFTYWMKDTYRDTAYTVDFDLLPRGARTATEAYPLRMVCDLYYLCFNEERIREEGVYERACASPEYANAAAYIGLHLVCAARDTDLARLPRPELPASPAGVLGAVSGGTFTDREACAVLYSMMNRLDYFQLKPNKTAAYTGVDDVIIRPPHSLEPHFGRLLAVCAAHLAQSGTDDPDAPLVRNPGGYWTLRTLGDAELAEEFRERDPSPTAFSKSHMQLLSIHCAGGELRDGVRRYFLEVLFPQMARSHKGGRASYSASTQAYLKDNALAGLPHEVVASVMFERNILSCQASMFLDLVTGGKYSGLDFAQQTAVAAELGLSNREAELAVQAVSRARRDAWATMAGMLSQDAAGRRGLLVRVMENISDGSASGKDPGCRCFLTAMGRACAEPGLRSCYACPYRLDTRATLYHAASEVARLKGIKNHARTPGEREKCRLIVSQYLFPIIGQAGEVAGQVHGDGAGDAVRDIVLGALGKGGEA